MTTKPGVCVLSSSVSRSQMSSEKQEALLENVTRLGDRSEALQESLGQLPSQSDLLENIWKLERLFHNHSEELRQLGTTQMQKGKKKRNTM